MDFPAAAGKSDRVLPEDEEVCLIADGTDLSATAKAMNEVTEGVLFAFLSSLRQIQIEGDFLSVRILS